MSVLQSTMYTNQLNAPFAARSHHTRASSFNELFAQLHPKYASREMRSVSPSSFSSPEFQCALRKRRSHSDQANVYSHTDLETPLAKRPKTAPSSPVSAPRPSVPDAAKKITLPSINDALRQMTPASMERLHTVKTLVPTVSLDYFDTYKPNDEQWRYGLLDSIRHTKPAFSLEKYAYLDKHASSKKLPSIHEMNSLCRPCFDSRVCSKALPTFTQRKINFPYESNYTYLNKTYLTDVERFPEYLELAQSLVQLSRPQVLPRVSAPASAQVPAPVQAPSSPKRQNPVPVHYNNTESHSKRQDSRRTPSSPNYTSYNGPILASPSTAKLPAISAPYATPELSFETPHSPPHHTEQQSTHKTRFIPITPPSVKDKTRLELMKSPPRISQTAPRTCISCGSDQLPCWRPSWSTHEGQLCNSCGLRYKKTAARCLNAECKKIPAKGEWALMQSKGKSTFENGEQAYGCLSCGCQVEVKR